MRVQLVHRFMRRLELQTQVGLRELRESELLRERGRRAAANRAAAAGKLRKKRAAAAAAERVASSEQRALRVLVLALGSRSLRQRTDQRI